jgi:hypothetical protein
MKYKVTRRQLKTKDKLIAAFCASEDAKVFITKKIAKDTADKMKSAYRLYDDLDLLQEYNSETFSSIDTEDAEAYIDAKFTFNVRIQPANTLDRTKIACFNDKADASLFISSKCASHAMDSFLIFKDEVLISTLNKNMLDNQAIRTSGSTDSSKHLSPLATRPTPAGGPKDYWIDKDDNTGSE